MISQLPVRGTVTIAEITPQTGETRIVECGHNLVTLSGVGILITRLMVGGGGPLTSFALGTGTTPATASDTALAAQVSTFQPIARATSTPPTLTVQLHITSTQFNGITIAEAGLFDLAGILFARYVLLTPYAKTNERAVTFTWDITFTPL